LTIRIGKLGIVRLTGKDLWELRRICWLRDNGRCRKCNEQTAYFPRFDGDPLAYDMAHIKSRGAGGSDTLDNVQTLCHRDHMREHTQGRTEGHMVT
jgi:5-methylcytosine-specific restriction endonuclease McrA